MSKKPLEPVILEIVFGLDQKDFIDRLIDRMKTDGEILQAIEHLQSDGVLYTIEFQNIYWFYAFGWRNANMFLFNNPTYPAI